MAESMNIFVASSLPLEAFVKEVSSLLDFQFQFSEDQYEKWYVALLPQGKVTLGKHEFENNKDMKFEDFNFVIDFWVNRNLDDSNREQTKQAVGRKIFSALKQTGKYRLMLVHDVQTKIDEFRPQLEGSSQG
jgi:hypothetical protein